MGLLIKQVRLQDGKALQDAAIKERKVTKTTPAITGDAREAVETDGRVLIPGFIESHLHLDKTLIADRKPNKPGTLREAIEITVELKPAFTEEDIYDHAKRALEVLTVHGTMALRTHAEFDPTQGFTDSKIIMRLKEEYKELIDM